MALRSTPATSAVNPASVATSRRRLAAAPAAAGTQRVQNTTLLSFGSPLATPCGKLWLPDGGRSSPLLWQAVRPSPALATVNHAAPRRNPRRSMAASPRLVDDPVDDSMLESSAIRA